VKLKRLAIERLPGIAEGFALEGLAAGVNLVTGPNTIGKSSLVRALGYLLRGHEKGDPPVSLAAEFSGSDSLGDSHWQVQRTGSATQWTRDGQPCERPSLPDAEELGRYCMAMEDLITASGADEALAGELQRALRGGFDLNQARKPIGGRHGATEEKALTGARNELRKAEQGAQSLSGRADRLPALAAEIQQAREAEARHRDIERARELSEAAREGESLREALGQFPDGMDELGGGEGSKLDTLKARVEKLREKQRDTVHERDRAESELARLGFSGNSPDAADAADQALTRIESKLVEIRGLREEIARLRDDERSQRQKRDDAAAKLGGSGTPRLDIENFKKAEGIAPQLLALRNKRDELNNRIELAGTAPDEQEVRAHDKAIEALRDWLREQPGAHSGLILAAFLIFGSILSLLAGALAPTATGRDLAAMWGLTPPPLTGLVLVLLSALLSVAAWRQLRRGVNPRRVIAREHYDATGLPALATWRKKEVGARLRELEVARGRLYVLQKSAEIAEGQRHELAKTCAELEELEQRRGQLAATIGFDPELPITSLDRFIRFAQDWDRESAAVAETEGKMTDRQASLDQALPALAALLKPWDGGAQTDFDSLAAAADSFKSRLKQAREQAEKHRAAAAEINSIQPQIETCERDIETIFAEAGLTAEEEPALRERLDRLPDWKEMQRKHDECQTRRKQFRRDLKDAPDLCEIAEAQDAAELERLSDLAQSDAGQFDKLVKEHEQIQAEIKFAESGNSIAEAISVRAEAQAALENKRDELLDSLATDLLLDAVESAYTADHQPEVLRGAAALFRQVTAHEFELELGHSLGGSGGFQARDRKQNATRQLAELSTGTRMQLLLAVRAAWVGRHRSLPLFLDEALTTSDEERTSEVVRSLGALAGAGGVQVVYFSARRNEASLWREALGDELRVIDLAEARGRKPQTEAAIFTLEPRPPVPPPAGTAEEYARLLAVPPIDPRRDAGGIHLFHLLRDDLDRLHSLLRDFRCESLGQAESLLATQALATNDAGGDWQSRLLARCGAARAWLDALRQGRGGQIGRNELEASGAVSDKFLDAAVALLDANETPGEVSGDAFFGEALGNSRHLLASLRAGALKGYRQSKIEELEAWLRAEGHIDDRPVLSKDERRARALRQGGQTHPAAAADINRCIDQLEAGLGKL